MSQSEYGPFPDVEDVAGVSFDGDLIWFATEDRLNALDPDSGVFVSGVTWVGGELWHGTWEEDQSDIRRIDPSTGEVLERLHMPPGTGVSGLESDGRDRFFCGGGPCGTVRTIRKPR